MSTRYHYSRYRGYGLRFAVYGGEVDVFIGDIPAGNDNVVCGSFPTLDAACDYIDDLEEVAKADAKEMVRETLDEVNQRRGYEKED